MGRNKDVLEKEIGLSPGNKLLDIPEGTRLRVVSGRSIVIAISHQDGSEPWFEELLAGEFVIAKGRKVG